MQDSPLGSLMRDSCDTFHFTDEETEIQKLGDPLESCSQTVTEHKTTRPPSFSLNTSSAC